MTCVRSGVRGGHSRRDRLKRRPALLPTVLFALSASAAMAAPPRYFDSFEQAYAACLADEWGTSCTYGQPAFFAYCQSPYTAIPWGVGMHAIGRIETSIPSAGFYCWNGTTTYSHYVWPDGPCPSGTRFVAPGGCVAEPIVERAQSSQKELGGPGSSGLAGGLVGSACTLYGNPCDAATGNKLQREVDFEGSDGIPELVRTYNSLDLTDSAGMGIGWMHSGGSRLQVGTSSATRIGDDGRRTTWLREGTGSWSAQADGNERLVQDGSGFVVRAPDGGVTRYRLDGSIENSTDRQGRQTIYTHAGGMLASIVGPYGHRIAFRSEGTVRIATLPDGREIRYVRDARGRLVSVTRLEGTVTLDTRQYHYESEAFPSGLTGITDERGVRLATYAYGADGRAVLTERAQGQQRFTLSEGSESTRVTDAAGAQQTLVFDTLLGVRRLVRRTGADGTTLEQTFDAHNRLTSRTDERGTRTTYAWDEALRPVEIVEAAGTGQARTRRLTYADPVGERLASIAEPSVVPGQERVTALTYGDTRYPDLPTRVERSGRREDGTLISSVITLTYTARGQLASIDGPRADVDDRLVFAYHDCLTGGACGQVSSITDALGHVTRFEAYDGAGRLLRRVDPDGRITVYAYDTRGRIIERTETSVSGLQRRAVFRYDAAGHPVFLRELDGVGVSFTWSAAGELVALETEAGALLEIERDARGDPTVERLTAGDGTLLRRIERTFDVHRNVRTERDGLAMSTTVIDALGALRSRTDPKGQTETFTVDALGRLVSAPVQY